MDTSQVPKDEDLLGLAESSPNLAVIEAWQRIEALLLEFLPPSGENKRRNNFWSMEIVRKLHQNKQISSNLFLLIKRLRDLRNRAVHVGHSDLAPITNKSAYEYLEMAGVVRRLLKDLKGISLPDESEGGASPNK